MTNKTFAPVIILVCAMLACNLPASGGGLPGAAGADESTPPPAVDEATATPPPTPTGTAAIVHILAPASEGKSGVPIFDVESSVTAAEKRAPYGDSYDIN